MCQKGQQTLQTLYSLLKASGYNSSRLKCHKPILPISVFFISLTNYLYSTIHQTDTGSPGRAVLIACPECSVCFYALLKWSDMNDWETLILLGWIEASLCHWVRCIRNSILFPIQSTTFVKISALHGIGCHFRHSHCIDHARRWGGVFFWMKMIM